jgi:prolipoprotein diacylglyceryltransferase
MRAYPIAFLVGCILSLTWLGWGMPHFYRPRSFIEQQLTGRDYLDAGMWSLALGLLGARLAFVVGHWEYYISRPTQMLWFGQGGLNWAGGAIGGAVGLGAYCLLSHAPFWRLADALSLPATILSIAAWTGCLLDGCGYGIVVQSDFPAWPSPDMLGTLAPRWPTQSAGALFGLALLLILLRMQDSGLPSGFLACLTCGALSMSLLGLSLLRADPVPLWRGLREDTIGAGILLAASLLTGAWLLRGGREIEAA